MAHHKRSPKRADRASIRQRQLEQCETILQRATEAHRNGDLDVARQLYRRILEVQPRHPEAAHLLGFAEFQSSRFEAAIEHLELAVSLRPTAGEFHHNLALAYLGAGKLDSANCQAEMARNLAYCDAQGFLFVGWELARQRKFAVAESAYRLSMLAEPNLADPHNYLGVLFAGQGRWNEAIECYLVALSLSPKHVEALVNLGNAHRERKHLSNAIDCYQKALQFDSRCVPALINLGVAWAQNGQTESAMECYRQAVELQPDAVEAWNNLGNACRDLGRTRDAVECYEQALSRHPASAEVLCNLAASLQQLGQLPAATATFRRAVMLQPHSTQMHLHLASALADEGRFADAAACCRHVTQLQPDQPLWLLRSASLCPVVFSSRLEMEETRRILPETIAALAGQDFTISLEQLADLAPPFPFGWQFFDGNLREIKQAYADLFFSRIDQAGRTQWFPKWRGPRTRPRIGFVVTDSHEGVFLRSLRGILSRMSDRWEPIVLCSAAGSTRIRCELGMDGIQVASLPAQFERMAQSIADTRCDLLYYWEVGTDATNYFLPFLRLAPIQMLSWGAQLTSGIPNLDAYLSSELIEPNQSQSHYSERLMLIRSLMTYCRRPDVPSHPRSRSDFSVPPDFNWYVCAQQLGKFHVDFDAMLAEILTMDPRGVVVITGDKYGHQATRLRRRFVEEMPAVADRIHILPRLNQSDYLSLLAHADVLLDPPHFSGANSSYDGLSFGQPIVTLPSLFQRGRYTLGCYRQMGLDDCIASDPASYCRLAVRLAGDRDFSRKLSGEIRAASRTLFEDDSVVAEHERVFDELLGAGSNGD